MANPTTNYSFAMPTNTDLVKDLPADFDIFGQAVDDRIKALNPETTAGDISYRASTANAKTRLPIGTAGQVLAVNSGATAPEWATLSSGGMTLLSTTSLSTNSVTISSISGSYKNLYILARDISVSTNDNVNMRFNSDSGSNYSEGRIRISNTTLTGNSTLTATYIEILEAHTSNAWNLEGFFQMTIPRYAESEIKSFWCGSLGSQNGSTKKSDMRQGSFNSTSAISSITVYCEGGGTTFSSGTVYVYGVS
jgi:hypothetical protein